MRLCGFEALASSPQALKASRPYNTDMAMCGGPPDPNDKPATNKSGRTVKCVKFQKELPGLDAPPWPGEIGQRVFENVSAQAW